MTQRHPLGGTTISPESLPIATICTYFNYAHFLCSQARTPNPRLSGIPLPDPGTTPEREGGRRPEHVESRETFRVRKGNLMVLERTYGNANIASLVERKTRLSILFRNNDRLIWHGP